MKTVGLAALGASLLWLAAAPVAAAPAGSPGPAAGSPGPPAGGGYLVEAAPPVALGSDLPQPSLWKMAGSLAIVIGLLLTGSYLTRRFLGARLGLGQTDSRMRIAQTLALGSRRFLSLVEVDGQGLLLGVSGDRIQLLHVLDGGTRFQLPEEDV